jgi:hypothetical protein
LRPSSPAIRLGLSPRSKTPNGVAAIERSRILLDNAGVLEFLEMDSSDGPPGARAVFGNILAVGFLYPDIGVFRIHPATGAIAVLNDGFAWQLPTAVAVDGSGEIFVADAGLCADGLCAGGQIVYVDPASGAATALTSGGHITGEMDLAFVPEPDGLTGLLAGLVALGALGSPGASRFARPRRL